MSTSTANLGLVKPDGPDRALVAVINENMNKIDQAVGPLPSGKTLQGQITDVSEKTEDLRVATSISNATSLANIESALLTLANSMESHETLPVAVWIQGSSLPFKTGVTYFGELQINSKSTNALYFSCDFVGYDGHHVTLGYNNGTWVASSIDDKTTWKHLGTIESVNDSVTIPDGISEIIIAQEVNYENRYGVILLNSNSTTYHVTTISCYTKGTTFYQQQKTLQLNAYAKVYAPDGSEMQTYSLHVYAK